MRAEPESDIENSPREYSVPRLPPLFGLVDVALPDCIYLAGLFMRQCENTVTLSTNGIFGDTNCQANACQVQPVLTHYCIYALHYFIQNQTWL